MIFSHNNDAYKRIRDQMASGKHNGAFYYSKEIVKNFIPNVKTDRNWVTVNVAGGCWNHSIVFIHSNVELDQRYSWLGLFDDLVLVCSNKETARWMERFGKVVYLPLSVDVDEVKKYRKEFGPQDDTPCYVGNRWAFKEDDLRKYLPKSYLNLSNLPREEILTEMARHKEVYAIGRCAIEAKILGCNVRVCDSRYPDPNEWVVLDNKEMAAVLQKGLDKIDGGGQ